MKILLLAVVATLAACASRADRYSENQQAVAQFRQTRPYLSNGLSDPDYQIEGKDVTLAQVQRFIGQFNETFLEAKSWEPTIRQAGASEFYSRLKKVDSLYEKMHGRFSEGFTLDRVNDVVGVRAVVANIAEQNKLVDWIYHSFTLVVHLDYVSQELKKDGYRAQHFTLRAKTGRLVELQVMTHNQLAFSNFAHDGIYKRSEAALKDNPEVQAYLKALSEVLYRQDQSGRHDSLVLPEPPLLLKERNLVFRLN